MSRYWQRNKPLKCPDDKSEMTWLGSVYWICHKCNLNQIKVTEARG